MSASQSSDERIVELEWIVTHLRHDLEQLNQIVLEQRKEIDELKTLLLRLTDRIEAAEAEPEARDPLQERPPHY
jgi:SlyX protein